MNTLSTRRILQSRPLKGEHARKRERRSHRPFRAFRDFRSIVTNPLLWAAVCVWGLWASMKGAI